MSGRTIAAICIVAALATLAGCAGSPDEPPGPSPDAFASRGYDAYNLGDYAGAIPYFEEALAIDPKNAFARRGLVAARDGVVYFGDRRPVKRDTRRAIRRVSLEGYEAYARGDLAGAGARFRAVLAVEPDNAYALDGLGAIRRKAVEAVADPVDGEDKGEGGAYLPVGPYEAYDAARDRAGLPSDRSAR